MSKLKQLFFIILSFGVLLYLLGCEREWSNPFDDKSGIDPESWAPINLTLTVNVSGSITLAWQQSFQNIEGFSIDRKKETEAWQTAIATVDKNQKTYTDEAVELTTIYTYRVYAFAGKNSSTSIEAGLRLPTVNTSEVFDITASSANSGGNILSDGGAPITDRGVVWSASENPTLHNNQGITSNGTGTGNFTSIISDLSPSTDYFVRAFATNIAGTSYGYQQTFSTQDGLPVLTTVIVTNITATSALSGGNITSDGGFSVTARGVVWSTIPNPTLSNNQGLSSNGIGSGSFTSNLIGLHAGKVYYVRAYATNNSGTQYGIQQMFTTLNDWDVYNPATGKIWMNRNLGASRVAISSTDAQAYGDLYQWGRRTDGHEKRTSGTTSSLSNSDTPSHGLYITIVSVNPPWDWRSPQNSNLWQGENGINNPCPNGYRLPTEAEWEAERKSWSSNNADGAFASPLKLPLGGNRIHGYGSLESVGIAGHYWSATIDGTKSKLLHFGSGGASVYGNRRANAVSVRCLKD